MDRYPVFLILLFLLIGVQAQYNYDDIEYEELLPPDEYANSPDKSAITDTCNCTSLTIDCSNRNLKLLPFTQQDISVLNPTRADFIVFFYVNTLNLSHNLIENMERGILPNLVNLAVLDLSYNKLKDTLSPEVFQGDLLTLFPISELNLAYNDIRLLHQHLFGELHRLTVLDLSGNPLTFYDYDTVSAITSLHMLQELNLRSCQLTKIPNQFFSNLQKLSHLDLSDNYFTTVPQQLGQAKGLLYLNLDQNPIENLDVDEDDDAPVFPAMGLEELHMCKMPELRHVGTGALANLWRLTKLHLTHNPKLTAIDQAALAWPDSFNSSYPAVKELYLVSNNLSSLPRQLMPSWHRLDKLEMSDNPFYCDCTMQWMVDDLSGTDLDSEWRNETEQLICEGPEALHGYSMAYIYAVYRTLECVDDDCSVEDVDYDAASSAASEERDNNVQNETGICRICICKNGIVNCKDKNQDKFFSLDEWGTIADIKPTKVDLSENQLTSISALANLPIEELDLSYNKIEVIENASFRDLAEIRVMDLSHNKLTSKLSPHAFEGHYSPEEYEPLSSMRVLNLAYNDFHSLNQDLFEHLPELTSLDLSGNPLTKIHHVTLIAISSLPMLKYLRLRSCQLAEIPHKLLHTPRYLEHLDLSDNQLTMVPQELAEAKNLVYLNLNQNPIVELDMKNEDALGFPILRKLQELHMCNMPELHRIGAGAMAGLEKLSKLHLSFNPKLTEIDPKAMARSDDFGETYVWPIIKELYLSSNNLSKVNAWWFSRWDLLEKVDVSDNPFLCDCSAQWMLDVLVPIVEHLKKNESEKLVCEGPEALHGNSMAYIYAVNRKLECDDDDSSVEEVDHDDSGEGDGAASTAPSVAILVSIVSLYTYMCYEDV